MGKNTQIFGLRIPWHVVGLIIIVFGIISGVTSSKCQIDNIKRGFSLKNGLHQDNIISFGQADSLEGCNHLCCKNQSVNVGLYDGIKCFGLACVGAHDKRCNLLRDGNPDYTIIKIVRDHSTFEDASKGKDVIKKDDHRHHSKQNKKHSSNSRKSFKDTRKTFSALKSGSHNTSRRSIRNITNKLINLRSTKPSDNFSTVLLPTTIVSNGITNKPIFFQNKNNISTKKHTRTSNRKKNSKNTTLKATSRNPHHKRDEKKINHKASNTSNTQMTYRNISSILILNSPENSKVLKNPTDKSTSHTKKDKRNHEKFHRKHKKRKKKKHHHKTLRKQSNSKTRFSRDYPYLYSTSKKSSIVNTDGSSVGVKTYSELMKANAADQALINKLLSERTHLDLQKSYIGTPLLEKQIIEPKGLPLQPVFQFSNNMKQSFHSDATTPRTDVYGNPLTMPLYYPQEKIKLDTYNTMQRNLLANLPTLGGINSKENNLIDPSLFLSDIHNGIEQSFKMPKSLTSSPITKKSEVTSQTLIANPIYHQNVSNLSYFPKPVYSQTMNKKNAVTKQKNMELASFSKALEPNQVNIIKKSSLKADIKSLKDFNTDKDVYEKDQKDLIPHPDAFDAAEDMLIGNEDIDVPFTTNMQLPKSNSLPQGLLTYPSYITQHYVADHEQHKQQPPIISNIYTTPLSASSSPSLSARHFTTNPTNHNIYSLMYPLSTIQRKTYQRLLLESKDANESDIEIADVQNNGDDHEQNQVSNPPKPLYFQNNFTESLHTPDKNLNATENIPMYPRDFINDKTLKNFSNSLTKALNSTAKINSSQSFSKNKISGQDSTTDDTKPSSDDVKKAIHEIDELREQVENLLTNDSTNVVNHTQIVKSTISVLPLSNSTNNSELNVLPRRKLVSTQNVLINNTTNLKNHTQIVKNTLSVLPLSNSTNNSTLNFSLRSKIVSPQKLNILSTKNSFSPKVQNETLALQSTLYDTEKIKKQNSTYVTNKLIKNTQQSFYTPPVASNINTSVTEHRKSNAGFHLTTKFLPPLKSHSNQLNIKKQTPKSKDLKSLYYNLLMISPKQILKKQSSTPSFTLGCNNPVGISKSTVVSDNNMRASSSEEGFPPTRGRLRIKENGESKKYLTLPHQDYIGSWCASRKSTQAGKLQFLQADIGDRKMFCRVAIQGDEKNKNWVKKFRLYFSDDGKYWEPYREDGKVKLFVGNEDEKDITYRTLKNPVMSRYIRFSPVSWSGEIPCMRVEVFNTSITRGGLIRSTLRSEIPKGHVGQLIDLDFEKMDDTIALDRSSFGNNGFSAGGALLFDTHSSCRHAMKLPPGADIVIDGTIMKKKPRDAVTISSWILLDKVEGVHSLFDTVGEHSKHDLGQFHFEVVGGDVRWFHRNESEVIIFNVITEKKMIRPNEWNHVAATYDSSTGDAIIYVNGTERVRGKGKGLISNDWNQRVGIGRHKGVRFLDGAIDEFKMFDVALDSTKIIDLAEKCDFSKYYCGSSLTSSSGTIVSPLYPDTLSGPVQCVWKIEGKFDEVIILDMKQLNIGNGKGDCGKATLEVRDTQNDTLIGSYCGSQTPRKITSHSNKMYLKYFTDGALPGERFKVQYQREKKLTSKKTLEEHCKASPTMKNVTLVGGANAGTFTDLGYSEDMDECKKRCCNNDDCEVAFMIDDNCYSVKCANNQLCKVRKAKPSNLNPMISFIGRSQTPPRVPEVDESEGDVDKANATPDSSTSTSSASNGICPHNDILQNSTLVGGIKAGNFTSRGLVENFDECLKHCCSSDDCDAAFMVKRTCFSLKCASSKLCGTRQAKPSPYHPVVSFLNRYKPKKKVDKTGATKELILPTSTSSKGSCKDNRVSKIYHDVTLKGGISSGDFTDKGHVTDINDCISKCCEMDTCNVAFVIKDTCFLVKCKSYEDCGLKSAVSEYYSPRIAYVNWNPPKDNLGDLPYNYKGCWRDFDITAFALPLLEGTDPKLIDAYKKRSDPVNDCSTVSQNRGFKVFAIQNGGACFSGPKAEETYKRYGKSDACKGGKGGPFANSVYKSFDDGSIIALGCWADLQDRAFKRMEKNDVLLNDNYDSRPDPIGTCGKVAEKLKMNYFALQKGGQCFVAKERNAAYDKYSPSRKCKYGLGGQMANDVYMLKKNFTVVETAKNREIQSKMPSLIPAFDQVQDDEVVYKEGIDGTDIVRYVYKAGEPISNVTLSSAINAGTFEDKGKVDNINECVKACGENEDCNVAFLLSSQCFNVHCFSDDTCSTKPAYSTFYKPELAFIKHRVIKRPKSQNTASKGLLSLSLKSDCQPITQLENMTFINGINAGNFSDMGRVENMDECKSRCCHDQDCHVAFKIQNDCYGVRCYNKESCKTRPAKNADLFRPQIAQIRAVKNSVDLALEKNRESSTTPSMTSSIVTTATASPSNNSLPTIAQLTPNIVTGISRSPTPPVSKCEADDWDQNIVSNETLVGGINAGDFRDHGQADTMNECMNYCCNEKDCDLSFMIDKDCYTVKCYKPSLCKTRIAKPTTFVPQIAFKKASKIVIDKSNLTELLQLRGHPTPANDTNELAYAAFKSVLLNLPDSYNSTIMKANKNTTNTTNLLKQMPNLLQNLLDGINEAIDFVQDTVTELTTDKEGLEKPFNILYRGLNTPPTTPTTQKTKLATTRKPRTVIPRPEDSKKGTTPSSSSVSFQPSGQATPSLGDPKQHSCKAEPIIYNATLRLGMHSGLFTKLGRVKTMDDCIERCCFSSNADVAYMLGPFCFAVKCKTREMCKPSPAMYSDITSLNLNPAISFLNKDSMQSLSPDDKDILDDSIFNQSIDSDDLIKHVIHNLTVSNFFLQQQEQEQQHITALSRQQNAVVSDRPTAQQNSSTTDKTTLSLKNKNISDIKTRNGQNRNKVIPTGYNRGLGSDDGMCQDSPITYNVTLRGGVHSGKFTELGESITMRECVGKCCDTPLCDVAFMFSKKCYAVGCYDEAQCQAVIAKPSSLNPKLAYVTKYRSNNAASSLADMPTGIEFSQSNAKCSAGKLNHEPVYINRTLFGGMKAGNFSYLGFAKDIKSCLSKCCETDKCDMAYLVNKKECFSVKCYTPELCQIADRPFHNKYIEISKLVKTKKRKNLKRSVFIAYLLAGLITVAAFLTGITWIALIIVKKRNLKCSSKTTDDDDDPKPDR